MTVDVENISDNFGLARRRKDRPRKRRNSLSLKEVRIVSPTVNSHNQKIDGSEDLSHLSVLL
jgi:hypothetical protein